MRKGLVLMATFLFSFICCPAQPFHLPPLDTLHASVDAYYEQLTAAQLEELKRKEKHRWLKYLPHPGYSPFAGGLTLSLNLTAPLQEIKVREELEQRRSSIQRLAQLQATTLKNEVTADHTILRHSIEEYNAKDSLHILKNKLFMLYSNQYRRKELTPSEYIGRQQEWEAFKVQRMAEANSIRRALLQLIIKAKAAIATNYDGL